MELDPLLKDLVEKKLVFRNNVACLTAELKDLRRRLASQEGNFARETQTRKVCHCLCFIVNNFWI